MPEECACLIEEHFVSNFHDKFIVLPRNLCVTVVKGVVTYKRKSLDADWSLIAENIYYSFDLLLYVLANSFGHVGTLAVERDVKQQIKQIRILFCNKT